MARCAKILYVIACPLCSLLPSSAGWATATVSFSGTGLPTPCTTGQVLLMIKFGFGNPGALVNWVPGQVSGPAIIPLQCTGCSA